MNFTIATERGCYLGFSSLLIFLLIDVLDFDKIAAAQLASSMGAAVYLIGVLAAAPAPASAIFRTRAALFALVAAYFFTGGALALWPHLPDFAQFWRLVIFAALLLFVIASGVFKPNFTAAFAAQNAAASHSAQIWRRYYFYVNLGMIAGLFCLPALHRALSFAPAILAAGGFCALALWAFVLSGRPAQPRAKRGVSKAAKSAADACSIGKSGASAEQIADSVADRAVVVGADKYAVNVADSVADRAAITPRAFTIAVAIVAALALAALSARALSFALAAAAVLTWAAYHRRAPRALLRAAAFNIAFYALLFQAFNVILLQFSPAALAHSAAPGWLIAWMFAAALALNFYLLRAQMPAARAFKLGLLACAAAWLLCSAASALPPASTAAFACAVGVYALFGAAQLLAGSAGLELAKKLAPAGQKEAQIYALWFLGSAAAQAAESLLVLALPALGEALYFGLFGLILLVLAALF